MKRILALLLLLTASAVMAVDTGYRIVHPDGTVEFTDDPTQGGEEVELREAPTFKAPRVNSSSPKPPQRQTDPGTGYRSVSILAPQQEQTVWFDANGLGISVQVVPALQSGHQVVVMMDGQEVARGAASSFTVADVFRGAHTVKALIVDSQGKTLKSSESVTFFMRQHTKP